MTTTSWWIGAATREEFTARLQQELPRMAVSPIAQRLRTYTLDTVLLGQYYLHSS